MSGRIGAAMLAALVLAVGAPGPGLAQPFPEEHLPPSLRAWVPWALDGVDGLGCPRVQDGFLCVWPGRLQLELDDRGGTFALELRADREAELRLPGSAQRWPQQVTLDGKPVPVFARQGEPHVAIEHAGEHRLAGRFDWRRLPESLEVPASVGLVDLTLDGRLVSRVRRDRRGLLWLGARADESASEGESLRLQVSRRIEDGIPVFVDTYLQLEVAGRAREVLLPEALLGGAVPVAVGGDLPARVEDSGLRVQLRGGRYDVSVRVRLEGNVREITPPPRQTPSWPEREVWVFAADERLRSVDVSGPTPIDPSRTELPDSWRSLPAYLVDAKDTLSLKVVRRGQPEPAPDALTLVRTLWLDPDGGAASVQDSFGGALHSTQRLDMRPPGALGSVTVDGEAQLITTTGAVAGAGVELRRSELAMVADSRLTLGGPLPAVGWSAGVESLSAVLNVPPGWRLLWVSGVDSAPGTWAARWTLLSFFFVLLAAFAADRLFGRRTALLAVITLVLTHGEAGAPFAVWLSLLGAIALRRASAAGRIGSVARVWFLVSGGLLVLILVPFARDQVRDALYPQVASVAAETRMYAAEGVAGIAALEEIDALGYVAGEEQYAPPPPPAPGRAKVQESLQRQAPMEYLADSVSTYNTALVRDPKAVTQTGPGLPAWSWRRYALSWSGPVGPEHEMRLFLASPGLNRVLTLLRLALLGVLSFVVLTGRWPTPPSLPSRRSAEMGAGLLACLVLIGATSARAEVAAAVETPDARLLQELREKLTRRPGCEPDCVTTPDLSLRLTGGRLEVSAEVHAAADGSWGLPGPLSSWSPSAVAVDGRTASALAHLGDGFLHVRLTPGVHRLEASGPVPAGDSFTLQFAATPRRARARAEGWDVSGLRVDAPPDASILFTRRLAAGVTAASEEGRYAPWLEVTRVVGYGVTWTVQTTVRRLTPPGAPVAVRVPLLRGEAPTRAGLSVEDGEVAVSLGGDEMITGWTSTLEQAQRLELHAPAEQPWSEVWRVQCSTIWSCTTSGLPPVERLSDGVFTPEFRPWPGETLVIAASHPEGLEGQTLTLDSLELSAAPGARRERVELQVRARTSREQPLLLGLPEAAEVQQVLVDGIERPLRPEGGELRVSVPTGAHVVKVTWQEPRGLGLAYRLPRVTLPVAAVNVSQQLELPPDRWLLLAHGPAWGPAILFWPYLVFVLAVAAVLGRLPTSPLSAGQWILLGLGLSQIPAVGALIVAVFVFALGARGRWTPSNAWAFDAMQLGLLVWALVSLGLLYSAIHTGLLFRPEMQVSGRGSVDTMLRWYADRVEGQTPAATVLSLPLWTYRVAMLAWSLWLASRFVRAVGWGWRTFGESGYWLPLRPIHRRHAASEAAPVPESDEEQPAPSD